LTCRVLIINNLGDVSADMHFCSGCTPRKKGYKSTFVRISVTFRISILNVQIAA